MPASPPSDAPVPGPVSMLAAPPPAPPHDPGAVPILMVDDDAQKRFALKAALAPLGHRIVEADSGIGALRCVMAEDFAVILLDVRMQGIDGFETATLIRQRRQSEMTPIIFITSHRPDEIDPTAGYIEGAVDFIYAPVPAGELRAKVSVFARIFEHAAQLAAAADDVKSSADQLRTLTDAAPVGIFQTDRDVRYTYTNPRWSEITGISRDDAAGMVWHKIMRPGPHAELVEDVTAGSVDPNALSRQFELRHAGPDERIVLMTAQAITAGDGEVTGWVGSLADVTAEAQVAEALSAARDAALSSSAMQQHFMVSVSHELKTPTSSIVGFVEVILDDDALTDDQRGFLEIIQRNAQRLSRLIDDLLLAGRTENGDLKMNLEATQMVPLVEQVTATFSEAAERAEVALVANWEPEVPTALVDPLRIEQVLGNLISNALKFTPEGGRIDVAVSGGTEAVEVSVADSGAGIDPADLDHIFERFYRTKEAVDNAVKGTGLGLAIAKGMVEAQHGTLRVTSALGQGSIFTMTLPGTAVEAGVG